MDDLFAISLDSPDPVLPPAPQEGHVQVLERIPSPFDDMPIFNFGAVLVAAIGGFILAKFVVPLVNTPLPDTSPGPGLYLPPRRIRLPHEEDEKA